MAVLIGALEMTVGRLTIPSDVQLALLCFQISLPDILNMLGRCKCQTQLSAMFAEYVTEKWQQVCTPILTPDSRAIYS